MLLWEKWFHGKVSESSIIKQQCDFYLYKTMQFLLIYVFPRLSMLSCMHAFGPVYGCYTVVCANVWLLLWCVHVVLVCEWVCVCLSVYNYVLLVMALWWALLFCVCLAGSGCREPDCSCFCSSSKMPYRISMTLCADMASSAPTKALRLSAPTEQGTDTRGTPQADTKHCFYSL